MIRSTILILTILLSVSAYGKMKSDTISDSLPARELSEVVVTGSNIAVKRNILPYTVSIIDAQQLEASTETRLLSDLSMAVPSLFVSERGILGFGVSNGGSGHIKMRGVGGERASGTLMMVDGQPQFAGIYSHHVADTYTKENVERVEVLRGPGSVLYGSNAMAGVINVITRTPRRQGVETTLSSQYGSYNTWLTSLTNTTRFGRFSSFASVSYDRTDGSIKGMVFRQWSGYFKAVYEISHNWKATTDFTLSNFKGNDPVYPRLSDPESIEIYRQNVSRGEASISLTDSYRNVGGNALIYYSFGNHIIDDPRHFHSNDDRLGVLLNQNFTPGDGASATVGFDFNTYSGRIPMSGGKPHSEGSLTTMDRQRITEYSPYLTISQQLISDRFVINAGLRMANSNRFDTQWIPQGGISYNAPFGLILKGSVSIGYRNPSFRELYLYRMANPDLQPEKMTNYEFSIERRFGSLLSLSATAYYASGRNMIQVLDQKNVNTGRFINKGIEISAQSRPTERLSLSATYSYLHTSLINLTGAPRQQYNIGAIWQPTRRWQLSANLRGAAHLFVSDKTPYQSFATVNMKVSFDAIRWLNLFIYMDNITNARYEINRGYEMPGFTIMGGFKLKI